jgi:hypothetical protein
VPFDHAVGFEARGCGADADDRVARDRWIGSRQPQASLF